MRRFTFWEANMLRNLEVSGGLEVRFACLYFRKGLDKELKNLMEFFQR